MISQPIKYFETDGIRGKFGQDPITGAFARRLGFTFGRMVSKGRTGNNRILIGRDTRISGTNLESAVAQGLSDAGLHAGLLGVVSTPALAHFTKEWDAIGGVMISASHNLFEDNGFKIFSANGEKISRDLEQVMEQGLNDCVDLIGIGTSKSNIHHCPGWIGQYEDSCLEGVGSRFNLNRFKIVVDCANGATFKTAPEILRHCGAEIFVIGNSPNGYNINSYVGSTNPSTLRKTVLNTNSDIGVAFDGDGDRVVMIDERGSLVDGDDILFVLAKYYLDSGRLNGGVVGTQMSNLGLEHSLVELGLQFDRASVGDRFVMERLKERCWILGGEPSGHIICRDAAVGGDGLVTCLQVLRYMAVEGARLCDLREGLVKFPQTVINVPVEDKFSVLNNSSLSEAILKAERLLGTAGRLLVRASGTEEIIRVMAEGQDQNAIDSIALGVANEIRNVTDTDRI